MPCLFFSENMIYNFGDDRCRVVGFLAYSVWKLTSSTEIFCIRTIRSKVPQLEFKKKKKKDLKRTCFWWEHSSRVGLESGWEVNNPRATVRTSDWKKNGRQIKKLFFLWSCYQFSSCNKLRTCNTHPNFMKKKSLLISPCGLCCLITASACSWLNRNRVHEWCSGIPVYYNFLTDVKKPGWFIPYL